MPTATPYGYTGANAYSSSSGLPIALAAGAGLLVGSAMDTTPDTMDTIGMVTARVTCTRCNAHLEVGLEDANLVFRVTELRLAMSYCPHSSTQRATI